jgi:hypothetical protein
MGFCLDIVFYHDRSWSFNITLAWCGAEDCYRQLCHLQGPAGLSSAIEVGASRAELAETLHNFSSAIK